MTNATLAKSLAEREGQLRSLGTRAEDLPLYWLIMQTRQSGPELKGVTELELYVRAHGDYFTGCRAYEESLAGDADNPCVRAYCLAVAAAASKQMAKEALPVSEAQQMERLHRFVFPASPKPQEQHV